MIWKLVIAAAAAALAALIVRQVKPELALFVQLGGVLVVALLLMGVLQELLTAVQGMLQFAPGGADGAGGVSFGGNSPYTMLVKALGICVTAQLAADVCRDSGSATLANTVELGGRHVLFPVLGPAAGLVAAVILLLALYMVFVVTSGVVRVKDLWRMVREK